jgi:hypothetical protein
VHVSGILAGGEMTRWSYLAIYPELVDVPGALNFVTH